MKLKSYLLLFALTVLLFFILGVRYGQKVEKTNKEINYILSLTPNKTPIPTKSLEFALYQNKVCGIQFLYPTTLDVKNTSSSAVFSQNNQTQIELDCDKTNKLLDIFDNPKTATSEITIKNKKTPIKTLNNSFTYLFKIDNVKNGRSIFVSLTKSLFPLFESTFIIN